jgi:hypothetical protein
MQGSASEGARNFVQVLLQNSKIQTRLGRDDFILFGKFRANRSRTAVRRLEFCAFGCAQEQLWNCVGCRVSVVAVGYRLSAFGQKQFDGVHGCQVSGVGCRVSGVGGRGAGGGVFNGNERCERSGGAARRKSIPRDSWDDGLDFPQDWIVFGAPL